MRLQKFLADAGIASRRKSEEYIVQGLVTINGRKVTELGTQVRETDLVAFQGKPVKRSENKVYILLNKPVGCVSTVSDDKGRKTVMDYIDTKERVFPVGRLDYQTSGMLLLTNDGDLAFHLTHPSKEVPKTYIATFKQQVEDAMLKPLRKGIKIEDYTTRPAKVHILESTPDHSRVEIAIHEGKNRQVRLMFEAIDLEIQNLRRTRIGDLTLKGLNRGESRNLTKNEVEYLRNL